MAVDKSAFFSHSLLVNIYLQETERLHFFSLFYFAINFGSFLSMIVTPVVRGECLHQVVHILCLWLAAAAFLHMLYT